MSTFQLDAVNGDDVKFCDGHAPAKSHQAILKVARPGDFVEVFYGRNKVVQTYDQFHSSFFHIYRMMSSEEEELFKKQVQQEHEML